MGFEDETARFLVDQTRMGHGDTRAVDDVMRTFLLMRAGDKTQARARLRRAFDAASPAEGELARHIRARLGSPAPDRLPQLDVDDGGEGEAENP